MITLNIAAILAGGIGKRMGKGTPKQFIQIDDKPIILKTLEVFNSHDEIDLILVVCLDEWKEELVKLVLKYRLDKVRFIERPGSTRRKSSFNAVMALKNVCSDNDIILIHDAARPYVSYTIISENIRKATSEGACETVVRTNDTIVLSEDGVYSENIPPREKMYLVQTPQSFKYSIIYDAHINYDDKLKRGENVPDITDDAGLVMFSKGKVALVKGDKLNIKITSPEDLIIYKAIIMNKNQ